MQHRLRSGALGAALLISALAGGCVIAPRPALAQSNIFLNGTVTSEGKPLAGAEVTLSGNNLRRTVKTDARGAFSFSGLSVGNYELTASQAGNRRSESVELTSAGATVELALGLREIGRTAVSVRAPVAQRSGADVVYGNEALTRTAHSGNFSELLLQAPGFSRGANGVVHVNGDHGDINYIVDGVQLPIEINRAIGTEFDPSNAAFVDVLQGAYPAQYGGRFGAVVNISTLGKAGPAGYSIDLKGGSYAAFDSTALVHAPLGRGGSFLASIRNERDGRALDPPGAAAYHDNGSNAAQLLHLTLPYGDDFWNLTLTHALQTYQIPNDVTGIGGPLVPAATDDNQRQDDLFASLQYHHAIGDRGAFSFGPSLKRTRLLDMGDYANDTAAALRDPQAPADPTPPGLTPATCANGALNALYLQGSPAGGLSDCALSIFADRTSLDYQLNADYVLKSVKHEIRAGATYDITKVTKLYDIAFQPDNYFSAGRFDVIDNAPNTGHTEGAYVQDSWKLSPRYELDYGLRADAFQLSSTQFSAAEFMLSPRVKLTRFLGPRSSVYAYYGRYFTPYSFENVSPSAAACVNPPAPAGAVPATPAATAAQCAAGTNSVVAGSPFDLKSQRDSVYELGGSLPLGSAQLGLRIMQKNSTHWIDDVQVGATNLHQYINFNQGRATVYTAYVQRPLPRNGRAYFSASRTQAEVKNCETQLLAQCVGEAADWIPADHDQRLAISGGLLLDDTRGGYFSIDGEYGSGLSTVPSDNTIDTGVQAAVQNPYCPAPPGGAGSDGCKVTPHLTFSAEKGFDLERGLSLAVGVQNLLDSNYFITYLNAQGNHYSRPRSFYLKVGLTR